MMRLLAVISLVVLPFVMASGQTPASQPTFEIADVHVSVRSMASANVMRSVTRSDRYELRNATMLDLVRTAYSVDPEKVVGGPNWLEYDRFDVIAKIQPNTPPETVKLMLQALLADRFKLAVHNDTRPVAGWVLTEGKGKHKLKEADPAGKSGCQNQPSTTIPVNIGPISSIPVQSFACRNMTMQAFAAALRGISTGYVTTDVVDQTGLKGAWDFDVKWTMRALMQLVGDAGISLVDAIDKQLGLKLEEQKLPTTVIVVDQVNQKPTANPPDLDAKLPAPPPAEFEVADIKPRAPGALQTPGQVGLLPGGRVNLPGFPLRLAISLAWGLNPTEPISGAPKWIETTSYDIIAKVPAELAPAPGTTTGINDLAPMLQALLKDRFKMKVHFEDQMVTAYTLTAAKHKLKRADPVTRTGCKTAQAPRNPATNSTPFGPLPILPSTIVTCQNMTMAQFADQLQLLANSQVRYPVVDGTGLEGVWDFSFTFSPVQASQLVGLRGAPPAGLPGAPEAAASDPIPETSIFDAVEKQLGLKLESQKRSYPVFVIDHIEEKPTEN